MGCESKLSLQLKLLHRLIRYFICLSLPGIVTNLIEIVYHRNNIMVPFPGYPAEKAFGLAHAQVL